MTRNAPPRTCGVCINPIRGAVYFEPIGLRDGLVPVGSCCHSPIPANEDTDDAPPRRGRPRKETPSDRTADGRAYRAALARDGFCHMGRSHGPRTHGVFCAKCAERSKRNSLARSARLRAAKEALR